MSLLDSSLSRYQNLVRIELEGLGRWYCSAPAKPDGSDSQTPLYPGVTTVLGETLYNKWANLDTKKDEAAVRGTAIHALFDAVLRGKETQIPKEYQEVVDVFKQWVAVKKVKPIWHEKIIVSEKYGFAGAIDLLAEVNGKVTVVDYKTGFEYDNKWGLQLAAYHLALAETLDMSLKDLAFGILHIPLRNPKAFKWLPFQHYEWLHRGFLAALELYKHQPRFTALQKMKWPYLFKPAVEAL